jgi:hypothetical protein
MPDHKDPLLEALKEGKSYTWTAPDGGDFASMRKAIKHGQTLTMSPVVNLSELQAGDMVLVKWHKGHIFHLVGEIQGDQFLIINSLGKVNGWVKGSDILGRITAIIEPEPRPDVPAMLEQLSEAYHALVQLEQATGDETQRLDAIVDDLRWYAGRIGPERWDSMPRSNKWSFAQNLWRLTKQARKMSSPAPHRVAYFIDYGKVCVGLAGEIFIFFEYGEMDF